MRLAAPKVTHKCVGNTKNKLTYSKKKYSFHLLCSFNREFLIIYHIKPFKWRCNFVWLSMVCSMYILKAPHSGMKYDKKKSNSKKHTAMQIIMHSLLVTKINRASQFFPKNSCNSLNIFPPIWAHCAPPVAINEMRAINLLQWPIYIWQLIVQCCAVENSYLWFCIHSFSLVISVSRGLLF